MHTEHIKEKVISLRKNDKWSINKIANHLSLSKSTVSIWVRDYPLSEDDKKKRYSEGGKKSIKSKEPESKYWKMIPKDISSSKMGKISESAVLFRLSLLGLSIYGSNYDGDKIDWIVYNPTSKNIFKVQVKTAKSAKTGLPLIPLRCSHGRNKFKPYEDGDFDILIGYDVYSDTCYVYSWSDVKNYKTTISGSESSKENWEIFFN